MPNFTLRGSGMYQVRIPAPPPASCVTSGKSGDPSGPRVLFCAMRALMPCMTMEEALAAARGGQPGARPALPAVTQVLPS